MAVLHVIFLLFTNYFLIIKGSYHWVVTENGKIQSKAENSGFPLKRPDDLMLLLEQEQRISAITQTYKKLVLFEQLIDNHWAKIEEKADLEKRLYSSDVDCILGAKPLTQHDLTTEFMDYGQGSRPKMKSGISLFEPDCTAYSSLEFSMMTFPHLKTLNRRDNLTVNSVPSKATIYFDINAMLKKNQSDWTAYNIASLYWRIMGNGTNALECAKRAIYFSPRHKRYIVLLNLGTLLQELESLGEAAVVLHSAVDHDPLQHISHLALGNVYAALGDYTRSLACYDNVLRLYPEHEKAMQLKHAIFCHKKLEASLLEIHLSLQNITQDLQKYHEIREKWLFLQNQVNWDKDNRIRDSYIFSYSAYSNLRSLHSDIKQKMKSSIKNINRNDLEAPDFDQPGSKNPGDSDCIYEGDLTLRNQVGNPKMHWSGEESCYYNIRKDITKEKEDGEIDKLFDNSDSRLRSKMNSLIDFIKLINYDADVNIVEFKRQIHHQINFLKNVNMESHFSEDQITFLNNFHKCLDGHNEFKKLSKCFMKVLDMYSINVSNRIAKLKDKIKLVNKLPPKDETKRNYLSDESSLENYVEVNPELIFETDSCQRLRGTTEL